MNEQHKSLFESLAANYFDELQGEYFERMLRDIDRQIKFLDEEQQRAKLMVNGGLFNCTTAPYVIVKRYRDDIKRHLQVLRENRISIMEELHNAN